MQNPVKIKLKKLPEKLESTFSDDLKLLRQFFFEKIQGDENNGK